MAGEALIAAAGLMGLAGLPHCVAMCAAPCAALTRGDGSAQAAFQMARVAGYAATGAAAALGVGVLREALAWSPLLRPLWTLLHLLGLAFGAWMLWHGRWPALLQRRVAAPPVAANGWQRIALPLRSSAAGALWIAWPCALSQAALLVAALGSTPQQGAAAMAAFAIASSPALWLGPALVRGLRARSNGAFALGANAAWPVRLAGACIVLGSTWALGHGLWQRVAALCGWE